MSCEVSLFKSIELSQFHRNGDENGPATDIVTKIARIDIEGSIATARLELDNWTGHKFTDFFTLLKVDSEWKIMNKIFRLHTDN